MSRCQTIAGARPVTCSIATARSRSQLEPGKTMTALFIAGCHPLDPEILDHRVGEQLAAHRLDVGVAGAVGKVELDQLAGADVLDAAEAEAFERMVDRLALRVEHAGLQGDEHARFHGLGLPAGGCCARPMPPRRASAASFTQLFTNLWPEIASAGRCRAGVVRSERHDCRHRRHDVRRAVRLGRRLFRLVRSRRARSSSPCSPPSSSASSAATRPRADPRPLAALGRRGEAASALCPIAEAAHRDDADGRAAFVMPFHDDVVGRPGFLHGGAIAGLLEFAAFTALAARIGDDAVDDEAGDRHGRLYARRDAAATPSPRR